VLNNFFLENHVIWNILWKNVVQPGSPQMTTWCVRFGCWVAVQEWRHTPIIFNTHCSSTPTMVTRRLTLILRVLFLSPPHLCQLYGSTSRLANSYWGRFPGVVQPYTNTELVPGLRTCRAIPPLSRTLSFRDTNIINYTQGQLYVTYLERGLDVQIQ
jgi:hypothetical protein